MKQPLGSNFILGDVNAFDILLLGDGLFFIAKCDYIEKWDLLRLREDPMVWMKRMNTDVR
ncbi:hypothetical protein IFO69_12280 [Echinicola sp. CAU 1574]|uniref:Uncharacterized protein n=1 Tax=Echinicola arenosa TaxID=2774144 RepID=A0ABR9AL38_9BACT|nr:hypothetical protein [Echinicola arenosa]MBD8489523.1 hypothetical protein [Echinicola arenosa]